MRRELLPTRGAKKGRPSRLESQLLPEERVKLVFQRTKTWETASELAAMPPGTYAVPCNRRQEAVDSLAPAEALMFQCTVASTHSLDDGILNILEALPASSTPVLYYVVPTSKQFLQWKYARPKPNAKVSCNKK